MAGSSCEANILDEGLGDQLLRQQDVVVCLEPRAHHAGLVHLQHGIDRDAVGGKPLDAGDEAVARKIEASASIPYLADWLFIAMLSLLSNGRHGCADDALFRTISPR
jgi:hypothetical protein